MDKVLSRLAEPSTWRGIVVLASGVGVTVSPEMIEAFISLAFILNGLIGVFTADKKKEEQD